MLPIQQLQELIQGKKVAFIGAGVSHKRCIEQFVELGATSSPPASPCWTSPTS